MKMVFSDINMNKLKGRIYAGINTVDEALNDIKRENYNGNR